MEWADTAIILSARPHGERAAVVDVLSAQHGRWQGRVQAAQSGSKKAWLSAGTIVQATWRARLEEQLGSLIMEPTLHTSAHVFDDVAALLALEYVAQLVRDVTPERLPLPLVFEALHEFISELDNGEAVRGVIDFERKFLDAMGYGLDTSSCAVTGVTGNLTHISPNTGRAVCADEAEPYKDKLLPLPAYWLASPKPFGEGGNDAQAVPDLLAAAYVTGYFLTQHFYMPPKALPAQRQQLLSAVASAASLRA